MGGSITQIVYGEGFQAIIRVKNRREEAGGRRQEAGYRRQAKGYRRQETVSKRFFQCEKHPPPARSLPRSGEGPPPPAWDKGPVISGVPLVSPFGGGEGEDEKRGGRRIEGARCAWRAVLAQIRIFGCPFYSIS